MRDCRGPGRSSRTSKQERFCLDPDPGEVDDLRIIYLHQYFNTRLMPGGTRSFEMGRRLVRCGHEVHMVTTYRWPAGDRKIGTWFETEEAGMRVHWFVLPYSNDMSYRQRIRAFLSFAWSAARRARRIEADLVYATSTPLTIVLPGAYVSARQRIPMVFEVRDLWPELPITLGVIKNPLLVWAARCLERFAYRRSKRVVALSPAMKAGVCRTGYPEDRVVVIPNSCDFDLFEVDPRLGLSLRARLDWLGDRPLVLYAGTLGAANRVDYLVRLAAEMRHVDPGVRFLVLGHGKEEGRIREVARALGVLDVNFRLMPRVPKVEMPAFLSAATITTSLVANIPQMWANSANKFFDALAAGRPIAINYGGWQAQLIEEHGIGLVLHPEDLKAASQQIAAVIRDGDWLSKAGSSARSLGQARFSRELLAQELEETLKHVAGNAGPSALDR